MAAQTWVTNGPQSIALLRQQRLQFSGSRILRHTQLGLSGICLGDFFLGFLILNCKLGSQHSEIVGHHETWTVSPKFSRWLLEVSERKIFLFLADWFYLFPKWMMIVTPT
jgi:hypothetical protein